MVTAVDSSILFDILTDDPLHGAGSLGALRTARQAGALLASPIVWAEVRAFFKTPETMMDVFSSAGIVFDPFDRDCADLAGQAWARYRKQGGARVRLIADFLIGAHAQVRGGRLVTRDRGFYRRYFSGLVILTG